MSFHCRYEIELRVRRSGSTFYGCLVVCTYNERQVYFGDCDEGYRTVSPIVEGPERDLSKLILDVGVRYYIFGYIVRGVVVRSHMYTAAGVHRIVGVLHYWYDGYQYHGTIQLDFSKRDYYALEWSMFNTDHVTWYRNGSVDTWSIVNDKNAYDTYFFSFLATWLTTRMKHLHVLHNDDLITRPLIDTWRHVWSNWTKYIELSGFRVYAAYIDDYKSVSEPFIQPKSYGLLVLAGGAFLFLIMFCGLTIKQRRNIATDILRKRTPFPED